MARNPFSGPKAPWIEIYAQTQFMRQWRDSYSFTLVPYGPERCISRCKDPAKAARQIAAQAATKVSIWIDNRDYGEYEISCGPIDLCEAQVYERIVYLWQLHKAFYNEQD